MAFFSLTQNSQLKFFSLLIIHLWGAHSDIPGGGGGGGGGDVLILEQFEKSKMAANMAVSI